MAGHFWVSVRSLLGQWQVTFGSVAGHFWVSGRSLLGQWQVTFGSVTGHFWVSGRSLLGQWQVTFGSVAGHFWLKRPARSIKPSSFDIKSLCSMLKSDIYVIIKGIIHLNVNQNRIR